MPRHAARHATVALIRHLAARNLAAPKKRPGKIPPRLLPTAIMSGYTAAIRREVCALARACFDRVRPEILRLLVEQRAAEGRTDAAAPGIGAGRAAQLGKRAAEREEERLERELAAAQRAGERQGAKERKQAAAELSGAHAAGKRAAALIARAAAEFAAKLHPTALHEVVKQFGVATDRHARLQLDQQLRSAIGVPLSSIEKPTQDKIGQWTADQVALVKTVPERYFDRLQEDVQEAFAGGTHPSDLADDFEERYEMSERDAERLARDQVLSLAADVNHDRMEALGVERAIWRTMRDGRVSDDCAELEGEVFDLDEGVPPEGLLPGDSHPMCRCYSEPVLGDLLGDDPAE